MVEVIESIDLISLSFSARPHLVSLLQLLSLLLCWIRLLGIAFEASVPHNLVDHQKLYKNYEGNSVFIELYKEIKAINRGFAIKESC